MKKLAVSFSATLSVLVACSSVFAQDDQNRFLAAYNNALKDRGDIGALARFEALLPQVNVDFPTPATYFVLEGDTLASDLDVRNYLERKATEGLPPPDANTELIVHVENGAEAKWPVGAQTLKYAVVRSTFPDEASFQKVMSDLSAAASDWVASCASCKIEFEHEPQFDALAGMDDYQAAAATDALRFIVIYSGDSKGPIASSFFPSDSWDRRFLIVYPDFFTLSGGYTGRGVLRHEIGHILGYRHEHTRDITGCVFEDNHWAALTEYDAKSVMHYFCGGGGTRDLQLSALDVKGHNAHYGTPVP